MVCGTVHGAGLDVKVDWMENFFTTRPGTLRGRRPVATGSHLDIQPAAKYHYQDQPLQRWQNRFLRGRDNGTVRVTRELEVLRSLQENDLRRYNAIALMEWTNEEGARCLEQWVCSGAWSMKL